MATSTFNQSAFEMANFTAINETPQQDMALSIIEQYETLENVEWADMMATDNKICAVCYTPDNDTYTVIELGTITKEENFFTVTNPENELTSDMLETLYDAKVYVTGAFESTPELNEMHKIRCAAIAESGIDTSDDFLVITDKGLVAKIKKAIKDETTLRTADTLPIHENEDSDKVIGNASRGHGMPDAWWLKVIALRDAGLLWGVYQTESGLDYTEY